MQHQNDSSSLDIQEGGSLASVPPVNIGQSLDAETFTTAIIDDSKAMEVGIEDLRSRFNLSDIAARVLMARRCDDKNSCSVAGSSLENYILPDLNRYMATVELEGLPEVMQHLLTLRNNGRSVCIISDYDVDGATAAAQLALLCDALRIKYVLQPTDRFCGGYGLTDSRVKQAVTTGADTIIAVDIGTRDHEALAAARLAGITTIVIDHHQLSRLVTQQTKPVVVRPDCDIFVSPHLGQQGLDVEAVCASALVYCLIDRLREECLAASASDLKAAAVSIPLGHCLSLATLGTIADVMPLRGFNRALVSEGLKELTFTNNIGLAALKEVAGVHGLVSAQAVAFQLGPRINAMGRIVEDRVPGILKAIGLFVSRDEEQAAAAALELTHENSRRKNLERAGVAIAMAEIEKKLADGVSFPAVLVIKEGAIHPGVAGIIAARLVERYGRPVVVVGLEDSNGICRGSMRSPVGVNCIELLEAVGESLIQCGGHVAAAGLSVRRSDLERFETLINQQSMARYGVDVPIPERRADIEVTLKELLNAPFLEEELRIFEPCGYGNAKPSFFLRDVTVVATRSLTGGHSEVLFRQGSALGTGLLWNRTGKAQELKVGAVVSLIVESHPRDFFRRFDVRSRGNVFGILQTVMSGH